MGGMGVYTGLLAVGAAKTAAFSLTVITAAKVCLCVGLLLLAAAIVCFFVFDMRSLFRLLLGRLRHRSQKMTGITNVTTRKLNEAQLYPTTKKGFSATKSKSDKTDALTMTGKIKQPARTRVSLPLLPPRNEIRFPNHKAPTPTPPTMPMPTPPTPPTTTTTTTATTTPVSGSDKPPREASVQKDGKHKFIETYSLVFVHTDERA